jgi:hypothetical protein
VRRETVKLLRAEEDEHAGQEYDERSDIIHVEE